MAAARNHEYSVFESVLYLAFELSNTKWKLGFTTGPGRRARERSITAGDLEALQEEIGRAKKRFDLAEGSRVVSCYEAGRDAFWLHRYLEQQGIENLVVDSSSIQVNRRARQAKTDRMDVEKLLGQLIQYRGGDRAVWSVVRVPSVEAEDNRQLHRELETLKKDRTRHTNRIKSFLVGQGIRMKVGNDFLEEIEQVRKWDGSALPASLKARLQREYQRLQLLQEQIKELERERVEAIRHGEDESVQVVRELLRLKGIGQNASWLFGMEFFSWRKFPGLRSGQATTGRKWGPWPVWCRCRGRVETATGSRGSAKPATGTSGGWRSRSRGGGCSFSRRANCRSGTRRDLAEAANGSGKSGSWRWPGSC
jgi:transposase